MLGKVQNNLYKKPVALCRQLRSELNQLRSEYKQVVGKKETGAFEWLRDNFYLLEREGKSALRELSHDLLLKTGDSDMPQIYLTCEQAARSGENCGEVICSLLEESEIAFETRELESIILMLRAAFIHLAYEAIAAGNALLIKSAVGGLRSLSAIDIDTLIERFSLVEHIFEKDPSGIYPNMDEITRGRYRRECAKLAKSEEVSEEEAAEAILNHAFGAADERQRHVGYYLFECGKSRRGLIKKGTFFLWLRLLLPAVAAILLSWWVKTWWASLLIYLPLSEAMRPIIDFFANKGVAPHFMPRMALNGVIPKSAPTLVTVSCLVPNADKAQNAVKRLEQLYLTNGQGEIKICMLADLKEAQVPYKPEDKPALDALSRAVGELNRKHGNRFILAVRPRVPIKTQGAFAGYERKRGAITQLVRYIKGEKTEFALLEGDTKFLRSVKYLIALDADTELLMDSAAQLVSAALHPLNTPQIDDKTKTVTAGYGIIAPKISTDIFSASKTPFSRIMSGAGGVTVYDTLSGDIYQDLFGRSIFAGKGLIDVNTFYACMDSALPDERILSHDILEGGFLRCGYMSDVEMTDGCPSGMIAFLDRLHRWIRGDWQNMLWLGKRVPYRDGFRKNPLNRLSKFMLLDNLRRSASPVMAGICLVCTFFAGAGASNLLAATALLSAAAGGLFAAVCSLISGGMQMLSRKYYSRVMPAALSSLAQALIASVALLQTAVISAQAISMALYRQLFAHKKLLEWVTAADVEKKSGGFPRILKKCAASIIIGILLFFQGSDIVRLAAILTLSAPFVIYLTARTAKTTAQPLSFGQQEKIRSYAAAMWRYYEELCTERNHFLPPDNLQESPVQAIAHRTSPTNIGLMLLGTLAARDFGFIDTSVMYKRIKAAIESTEKCEKWQGNLLNWYDTRTLRPLFPRFVSTVDSGNYACCLLTLYVGLEEYAPEYPPINELRLKISEQLEQIDLTPFYSKRRKLFHIGYDMENSCLSESFYDLLMSESRMTSYYAIASRQIPKKHWGALGRTLAKEGGFAGPVSWTGTMFEYFMPHLLLPVYNSSLNFEALRFCVYCQRKRAKLKNAPYGCSESGFYAFDPQFNYQYKAHGIQRLGLKRHLNREYVVSPYSTFLTLGTVPQTSIKNLSRLERMGMTGRYGFFEAADFTKSRTGSADYAIVRSYMAHHVGMSLLSAANLLSNNLMQERFMRADRMRAAKELLEEKIPAGTAVFEDVIERDVPDKLGRYSAPNEQFNRITPQHPQVHLLSNGAYTVLMTDSGTSVSTCQGVDITRRSDDLLRRPQGVFAVVGCEEEECGFSITQAPDYHGKAGYRAEFSRRYAAFFAEKGPLEAGMQVSVHERLQGEQRRFLIKNRSSRRIKTTLTIYFEPSLARAQDDAAHPAFSRLFIRTEYDNSLNTLDFTRRPRDGEANQIHVAVGFAEPVDFEYDCDREYVLDRPDGVSSIVASQRKAFHSSAGVPDPCAAIRITFDIPPKGQKTAALLITAAATKEEAVANLLVYRQEYTSKGAASPIFDGGLESRIGSAMLPGLLFATRDSKRRLEAARENQVGTAGLWAMGISGDLPIVLVELRNEADLVRAEPYFGLQRRLFRVGILFDLVLLYNEGGEYSQPITGAIRQAAVAAGTEDLIDQKGGIHAVDLLRLGEQSSVLLRAAANYIAPETVTKQPINTSEFSPVKFESGDRPKSDSADGLLVKGGSFCKDSFVVTSKPPLPWCHIMANDSFGTLVSDSALGYSWAKNARENKLTPWYNDTLTDNNGEMLILRVGGKYYNLLGNVRASFTPEYALYEGIIDTLEYSVKVTVPPNAMAKKVTLDFFNKGEAELDIDVSYYTEPVLAVNRHKARHVAAKWENGGLLLRNPFNASVPGTMLLTAEGGADECLCDRAAFLCGRWDEHTLSPLPDPCAAVVVKRKLPAKKDTAIHYILAFGESPEQAWEQAAVSPEKPNRIKITVKTNNPALDYMMNTWLPHQVEAARIYGRTGFYQCGGAFGFRDQLQDICAQMLWDPTAARDHILRCCAHQFEQGDVLHWWHELKTGHSGVRTNCSDDMMWLPYAVCEYVEITGDTTILDEQVNYLEGTELAENEHERYFTPQKSQTSGSVYDHCLRAAKRMKLGSHGLPLIGGGDWNDGFSKVGEKGRGESVWLAQFTALVYERMAGICVRRGDTESARTLLDEAAELKEAVDEQAWDGDWYLRAFFDDGRTMGAKGNSECEIDVLPQAFSALCNMPDKTRRTRAISAAMEKLVDRENGIIKLFWPPFDNKYDPGYIKGYPPGVRENGGQYTHAAIWLALSLFKENRPSEGYELLRYISPAERSMKPGIAARYKTEPYAVAADIYTCEGAIGRGGWSLYTGAAGWYYRTVLSEMLGILPRGGKLEIRPRLPEEMDKYEAELEYKTGRIQIEVKKGNKNEIEVDGEIVKEIHLDGKDHMVKITVKTE